MERFGRYTLVDKISSGGMADVYRAKVVATGSELFHLNVRIARDGHCNLRAPEILAAFLAMVNMANPPVAALAGEAR